MTTQTSSLVEAPRLKQPRVKVDWTPALKKVNNQYPLAIRSKKWAEIARLANTGKQEAALAMAATTETSKEIQARSFLARRVRVERTALFTRLAKGKRDLRAIFTQIGSDLARVMEKKGTKVANLPQINEKIHEAIVLMRRELNKWIAALVRDSVRLGLKNAGDALAPIFKNRQDTLKEIMESLDAMALEEAEGRARIFLQTTKKAGTKPHVALGSIKWRRNIRKAIQGILKQTTAGLRPSERIWELTTRAEATMKRIASSNVSAGTPSATLARKIKRFVSPSKIEEAQELGLKGVYASPFKNAMRLARTETNRAYTKATADFAKDKKFIKGIMITLSPAHNISDECDAYAGDIVSPERFTELVPFHPHCMCFGTYIFEDDAIQKEAA